MSLSSRPRIVISGYYGFGNTGDEAILAAMLQVLPAHLGEDADFCVLSRDPESTRRCLGVRAIGRMNPAAIAAEMMRASLVISGGGGLLQDSTGLNTIRYYTGLLRLARMFRKPVMLYAQGIGPVRSEAGRALVRDVVDRLQLVTVRDEESAALLRDMGVTVPPVHVTADPVLALRPADPARVDELLRREGLSSARPLVGLSVRPWPGSEATSIQCLAEVGRHLVAHRRVRVLVLPFQESQDRAICEELGRLIGDGCHVLRESPGPTEYMGLVGRLQAVVAMRLHALIFGAAQHVPTLGVAYDPKVTQFLGRVGAPVVPLEGLTAQVLIEKVEDMLDHGDEARAALSGSMPALVERAIENASLAGRLLRGKDLTPGGHPVRA